MRVFVVLAHPRTDSLNAALLQELVAGLREAGHEPDVADLYADGFDPRLSAQELQPLGEVRSAPDAQAYQARLLAARGFAFLFPVWWFGPPAIFKGFVDRVFAEHVAFRFGENGEVLGLLPRVKALVINTAGATAKQYEAAGFDAPLRQTLDRWTLGFCGVREVHHVILHGAAEADETTRVGWLAEARRLGREHFK